MDILAPRQKNWCGHFSANIIGQFSAVHMYIVFKIVDLKPEFCTGPSNDHFWAVWLNCPSGFREEAF